MPATWDVPAGDLPALYAALNSANVNGEADTVNLAPSAYYGLERPGGYPDGIPTGLTLLADGGNPLTINGNGATIARDFGSPEFRLFLVNSDAVVTLSGLTLRNGRSSGFLGTGGGILNLGTLTLSNSTLIGNSGESGGGIFNAGTLTLSNSTLFGNFADQGGGIYNNRTLTVSNCTLFGNFALDAGGGICNRRTMTVSNSTLSGNQALWDGGGIFSGLIGKADATLLNVTLTANRADADNGGEGTGGGISHRFPTGSLVLHNVLVAGNFRGSGSVRDDVNGVVTAASSCNLIGDGTGLTGISHTDGNANQVGGAGEPIDPRLGPLQNNGGPTVTHALLSGSPAINRGLFPGTPAFDQRGVGRNGIPDIGAYEFEGPLPAPPAPPVPPAPRSLVASLVSVKERQKRRLRVVVRYADTGEVRAAFASPFQRPAYRKIAVLALDTNGDGAADAVQVIGVKLGLRKKKVQRVIPV